MEERICDFIQCMLSYKSEMEFEGKDFNADKVKLYESVREKMAKIYVHGLSSFAPQNLEGYPFIGRDDNFLDDIELEEKNNWVRDRKIHQDLIKQRCSRIQEKIKEIRQNFSQAVISGRPMGFSSVERFLMEFALLKKQLIFFKCFLIIAMKYISREYMKTPLRECQFFFQNPLHSFFL